MNEDKLKQAFLKIKQDMFNLQTQLFELHGKIKEINRTIESDRQTDRQTNQQENTSTLRHINQTPSTISSTHPSPSTDTSTHNYHLEALKSPISQISTGNRGVSTDRQTDRQTDNTRQKFALNKENEDLKVISNVLESLNQLQADLSEKFQSLTQQEFLVFSAIYQLESASNQVDYSLLASKLSLTESSIRDYIQRMLKKGIPLVKTKENNKKIYISIPENLRKVAPLSAISSIRSR